MCTTIGSDNLSVRALALYLFKNSLGTQSMREGHYLRFFFCKSIGISSLTLLEWEPFSIIIINVLISIYSLNTPYSGIIHWVVSSSYFIWKFFFQWHYVVHIHSKKIISELFSSMDYTGSSGRWNWKILYVALSNNMDIVSKEPSDELH